MFVKARSFSLALAVVAVLFGSRGVQPVGATSNTLSGGQWLYPGQYMLSGNALFELSMQTDGNLVLYYNYGRMTPVWNTGTSGRSVKGVTMQTDGNFVMYNTGNAAIWATNTSGNPGAYLVDQNDGNLVLYGGSGALWYTFTSQDTPGTGYWAASDSNLPTAGLGGGSILYDEPNNSSLYGGYVAEVDTYYDDICGTPGGGVATNPTDVSAANYNNGVNPATMGTALYYFMGGPGADPSFNNTTTEAYAWGQFQAWKAVTTENSVGPSYRTGIIFMDIENSENTNNGWSDWYQNCGHYDPAYAISTSVARATFNGFWDYVYNDSSFYPAVYSSPLMWNDTFGTGSDGSIPNTFEWTYEGQTYSTNAPSGWSYGATSAQWFGGTTKPLAWQWAIKNTDGGVGDFDQVYMCTWSSAC